MRLSLLVGLRVLRVDLTHHLRLLFVVLLDVLDGLLRLRRRNFYIHRRCRLRRPGGCKHDASALSIKMDLAQILRRDLVRVAGIGELQQALFRSIGNAPMQFVV